MIHNCKGEVNRKMGIAKSAAVAATAALILAPLAPLNVKHSVFDIFGAGRAEAASYVNVAVPTNTNLASGLLLFYSFDSTKFSTTTVTDESGNGKTGTPSVARNAVAGSSSVNVEALVVAGGGGGGGGAAYGNGGGGAGGYIASSSVTVTAQAYTITVGAGGAGDINGVGGNGGNSVFSTITSTGGGGGDGGSPCTAGNNGGSGGGAVGGCSAGTGTAGQGNNGGTGVTTGELGGGGGGGASAVGANGTSSAGGNGGAGTASSISGSSVTRAGGGGGGAFHTGSASSGGAGGGGNGGYYSFDGESWNVQVATAGTANTGGGGGGGAQANLGKAGGSGIVIISATTGAITSATGGTFTQSGGKDIWTFNSSGTWTPTLPAGSASTTAPLKTPGKIGQAIKFDGITASTTVGNVSASVKSVAFWAKVSTSTTAQNIMDLNGAGTNIRIVNGVVTANNFTSPTIYVDGAVSSTLNNTNWHHVVITTGTNVNASNVNLGVASSTYFGGSLDDLRIYNRALSAAEVKRLYQLGATSYVNVAVPSNTNNSSGLVLQYSFDSTKFSTTTITDESGNGKNGTPSVARNAVAGGANVEALVVAGGGGGGASIGGGGGAGGYVASSSMAVTAQAYTVTVGNGGAAEANGQNSVFSTITSTGGGTGANTTGVAGGSGGGGRVGSGGAGTAGQGNNGGSGYDVDPDEAGGGGGGASAVGANGTSGSGGNGGAGTANSISGSSVTYAGGGGGGKSTTGSGGTGGAGGGGNGGFGSTAGTNGTANTGGGGGGKGQTGAAGAGGSGIVIISATTGVITSATGGTFTQSGGKDIWTFTSSGTWTPTIPASSASTTAPLKTPGKIGQAIKFDGITASTTVGNVSASVKSVAFWAKVSTSTTAQNIMDLNGAGANIRIVSGTVTANGFTSPTIYVDGAVSSTLNNTNWHHVVITTGTNVNASNLSLGVASSTYYGGTLDDLRIYNRALSAAEVKRLYQLGATSYVNITVPSNTKNSSGLVLQYSFDSTKVSTSTVTDESGNGKTGTNGAAGSSGTVEALVVGGGGGGGMIGAGDGGGGGGGAGGYVASSSMAVTTQAYTITVGGGGAGSTVNTSKGSSGSNSVFGSITATGGGGGGSSGAGQNIGLSGGSGGGNSESGAAGGTGTAGQGNNGGSAGGSSGGSGGGASAVGGNGAGANNPGSPGGDGTANSISGSSVTYAGGGGGGRDGQVAQAAAGGAGGGGRGGGGSDFLDAVAGTANRGGGGGGGGRDGSNNLKSGAAGGSGIVIISATTSVVSNPTTAASCGAGCYTTSGGKDIWTFTSSGTWTPTFATVSKNFTRVPGKIGQAIKFDGSATSTSVGSVSSSVKSVAFWAKVSTSTTAQNVMDLNGAGTNIRIVSGVVTANGFTSPTIYVDGAVSSTLNNTNWHHVIITTGTNLNASNVSLGVASSTYFGGTLDDLRMYNRALSAAEVKRLYQLGN